VTLKKCTGCKVEKPMSEFAKAGPRARDNTEVLMNAAEYLRNNALLKAIAAPA